MESGWLVNSNLSRSAGSAAGRPGRWYQISPIAPPSWHALLQGRRSSTPQGFGTACARACSIDMKSLPNGSTKTTNFERATAPNSLKRQPRPRELVGRVDTGALEQKQRRKAEEIGET